MVYPVLQEKFARDKKNIAPIYPALLLRRHCPLALMEGRKAERIAVPPYGDNWIGGPPNGIRPTA